MDATYMERMLQGFTDNITECEPVGKQKAKSNPVKWELGDFESIDDARSFAIEHGWRATPQKVQIRGVIGGYLVEPYEENCGCPGLVPPY